MHGKLMRLIIYRLWGDGVEGVEGKRAENNTSLNVPFIYSSRLEACFPYSMMTTNKQTNIINPYGQKP